MIYITYADYTDLYGGEIDEITFNRLAFDACRKLDVHTTGVSGFRKLKYAFPTDEDDAEAVRRCACKIIHQMHQIEEAEANAVSSRGYEATENGMRGKVITSVSSGSESISYAAGDSKTQTAFEAAINDSVAREKLYADTIREALSGVADANGINLLYMG